MRARSSFFQSPCTPPHWQRPPSAARSARSPTACCFDTGGSPVLILTSGSHRVDTQLTSERIGVKQLKRATPEFVREHTGQVIGGVSPIGHPSPVPTYLDIQLGEYDVVWAAAGHPAAVYSTTYDELLAMTDAKEIEVD